MKQELDDALCRDFPNLYRDRYYAMPGETLMCFGFECGDGWEPLIRRLSAKLEAMILATPKYERLVYRAFQVKEKFGTLRFYMALGQTDEMTAVIREAEEESARTCERCGAPGSRRGRNYIATLCDEHAE